MKIIGDTPADDKELKADTLQSRELLPHSTEHMRIISKHRNSRQNAEGQCYIHISFVPPPYAIKVSQFDQLFVHHHFKKPGVLSPELNQKLAAYYWEKNVQKL